ncbi:hypothetical protein MLD38_006913 [Melastoma candidum]|uniref:Uncharacterized protein n=1 Tax=Melastoma candidum TaxID=119954 RepID=A0ACB9RNY2_9MYRT|nr:hypothetical protein MLD38_006913 [Melastoma candidum]
MDAAFHLGEVDRSNFIQIVMQSLGSSYACLWSLSPPAPSCLFYLDGWLRDSADVQLDAVFNQYKQSLFLIQQSHSQVPGLAFGNNMPYIKVGDNQLLTLASNDAQQKFYQDAGIKIAVFMGCRSGEIELGFSDMPRADLEMQIRTLFPEDFSRHLLVRDLPMLAENLNPPSSSSSSSLRSLSMDSPEYSSLLFVLPTTTSSPSQALLLTPTITDTAPTLTASFPPPLPLFQTAESEHAAMTSAFLAAMASPSSFSTSQQPQQQEPQEQQQRQQQPRENPWPRAFKSYVATTQFKPSSSRNLSMLKRAITYYGSMNMIRISERAQGAAACGGSSSRPITATQMHHMMSERKRREKLNKSFQSLKALLPPGTKKDKASVLVTTREYLCSLSSQVEDLRRKNAILEGQRLPPPTKESAPDEAVSTSSSPDQIRSEVEVQTRTISDTASTSSQDRIIDLRVTASGYVPTTDLVIRILEFLSQTGNINPLSIEADARVARQGGGMVNHVSMRLHVQGDDWDDSAFREAVRRVVADLPLPRPQ